MPLRMRRHPPARGGAEARPSKEARMRSPLTPGSAVTTEGAVPPRPSLLRPDHGPEARAVLAFPWATTPVGPLESWPDQLRLLVQVMLSSEFPMMVVWGSEYTQLYNEA